VSRHRRGGFGNPLRRPFVVFALLAGAGLALTTLSVRAPERVEGLQRAGLALTGPLVRLGASASLAVRDAGRGFASMRQAHSELEATRRELADLRLLLSDREELATENDRLRRLLDLRQRLPLTTLPARVLHRQDTPDRIVVIDRGRADGLVPDLSVVAPEGVVGKVLSVAEHVAQVQLLTDPEAGVAVVVGPDREQAHAIVKDSDGETCRLRYLDLLREVHEGDRVVTSGLDQIHPKGLLVGEVVAVNRVLGIDREIELRPAVDFRHLEEVLVLVGPERVAASESQPVAVSARRSP